LINQELPHHLHLPYAYLQTHTVNIFHHYTPTTCPQHNQTSLPLGSIAATMLQLAGQHITQSRQPRATALDQIVLHNEPPRV